MEHRTVDARARAAAGSLLLAAVLLLAGCSAEEPLPPDVLLITVDTLRADRVGSEERPHTPALDALAAGGVRFTHAIAPAPWTLPSMATIHTGLHPSEHGAVGAETGVEESMLTLAEVFRAQGYQTLGVVSHTFTDSAHGFAQGFERFDETQILGHDAVTSGALTRIAEEMLDASDPARPLFLWVHYFDPHFSYVDHDSVELAATGATELPPRLQSHFLKGRLAEFRQRGESFPPDELDYVEAVYAEEIELTDRWIGSLLAGHRARRAERPRVVAVTADHGEYFLERGRFFHGKDVYEELVHVPLILAGRGLDVGTVEPATVSLRDLGRTLVAAADLRPLGLAGHDLLGPDGPPPTVFAEGSYAWGSDQRKVAVYRGGLKLVHRLDDGGHELYDLERDPHERHDLFDDTHAQARAAGLLEALEGFPPSPAPPAAAVPLDEEERERLRSLGYVD